MLTARVESLVDERLFAAFWDGATHFGTRDLVLFFDESETTDPVSIIPRSQMTAADNLPASIKTKLRLPATSVAKQLTDSETSFWLVVLFTDGETCCVAVSAKPLAPGGHA